MSAAPFHVLRQRDTFHPGGVHEREYTGAARTQVTFSGPRDAVDARVKAYTREYDPRGYGTHVAVALHGHAFGESRITLLRSNGCD